MMTETGNCAEKVLGTWQIASFAVKTAVSLLNSKPNIKNWLWHKTTICKLKKEYRCYYSEGRGDRQRPFSRHNSSSRNIGLLSTSE